MPDATITASYEIAKQKYAALGIDTGAALAALARIPVSLHCWQGDDVGGFFEPWASACRRRHPSHRQLPRQSPPLHRRTSRRLPPGPQVHPGRHRMNLHASYLDNGGAYVERDQIEPRHFQSWIDWAKSNQLGIDFNPTYFSHPKAADGFTLTHPDRAIRQSWIDHGHRLPQDRRRNLPPAWLHHRHQRLIRTASKTPRRPNRPARAPHRSPRRHLRRAHRSRKLHLDAVEAKTLRHRR